MRKNSIRLDYEPPKVSKIICEIQAGYCASSQTFSNSTLEDWSFEDID